MHELKYNVCYFKILSNLYKAGKNPNPYGVYSNKYKMYKDEANQFVYPFLLIRPFYKFIEWLNLLHFVIDMENHM